MKTYLAHVGINTENEEEARAIASIFQSIFNMAITEEQSQIFLETDIEIMKKKGPGTYGHLAFAVEDIREAVYELQRKGVEFAEEQFKYNNEGTLCVAYLKNEIAGFAIHLLRA